MRRLFMFIALTMLAAYCTDNAIKRKKPQPRYKLLPTAYSYHLYKGDWLIDSIPYTDQIHNNNLLSTK